MMDIRALAELEDLDYANGLWLLDTILVLDRVYIKTVYDQMEENRKKEQSKRQRESMSGTRGRR